MTDEVVTTLEECGIDSSVLDEYDCVAVRARPVGGLVKLRTTTGARALKKVLLSADRMRFVHSVLEHVARRGQGQVPRFIRNRYGDPFIVHPTGIYYMTAWLPGRSPDFRKPTMIQMGARALGAWHRAASEFHGPVDPSLFVPGVDKRIEVMYRDFEEATEAAAQADAKTPFARLVLETQSEILERYQMARELLRTSGFAQAEEDAKSRGLLCHGSFQKQHLLVTDEATSILHYESVHQGLPIADFALFCHRYMPAFEWDEGILRAVIEAYGTATGQVARFDLLAALLSVPLRSLQVISWYYRRSKEWEEEDYLDYLEASLFMEENREDALRHLWSLVESLPAPLSSSRVISTDSGDWSVATFNLANEDDEPSDGRLMDGTLARAETSTNEDDEVDTEMADEHREDDDSPEVVPMKMSKGHDGILVIKPHHSRRPNRSSSRRASKRDKRAFQPQAPGLRLWGPNEHGGKHDEKKKKNNQIQRGGPEDSTQKE